MHLYTQSTSPNGRRVAVVLKEKGLSLPTTEIDLRAGENLLDEFTARNPIGRVPVLETDSGLYLSESIAISRYLESLVSEPNLFGRTGEEQARIEMWNRRAELNLMIPVAQAFRNLTGIFKDREKLSKEWGEISAEVARDTVHVFDDHLASSPYIAGEAFSVADITLALTLTFARAVGQDLLQLPHLVSWHDKVSSRASFA
ncbi:MAG: glutathione S-transferase family protein [Pseudomonadota bacterium]|nr:glutathione S-transferase family protein [Pseudomonadota bacterium]|tara:strand:+ start:264 stop:866 length:603 start_codon:yes stop_codon:yes gene_type:complete